MSFDKVCEVDSRISLVGVYEKSMNYTPILLKKVVLNQCQINLINNLIDNTRLEGVGLTLSQEIKEMLK